MARQRSLATNIQSDFLAIDDQNNFFIQNGPSTKNTTPLSQPIDLPIPILHILPALQGQFPGCRTKCPSKTPYRISSYTPFRRGKHRTPSVHCLRLYDSSEPGIHKVPEGNSYASSKGSVLYRNGPQPTVSIGLL